MTRLGLAVAVATLMVQGCVGESANPTGEPGENGSLEAPGFTETRYPIVLMPGILGFETLLGVVEYFPGIPEALAEEGAEVYVAYGSQVNSSVVRAQQIVVQLEELRAITGSTKFNLIAHSQGAIDARIIAGDRPDLVASVTSISGPHTGAKIADMVLSGDLTPLAAPMFGVLGDMFTLMAGSTEPNDVNAAMQELSTAGMADFNLRYPAAVPTTPCGDGAPEVGGIRYYSWGGVGTLTNPVDLLDPIWVLAGVASLQQNDGLIERCSTHLGQVIRDDYYLNHIDATNMVFGLVSPLGPRPTSLFRNQANRLMLAGL